MRTSDAASPVTGPQVFVSLIAFVVVYAFLGAIGFYLIGSHAKKGPVMALAKNR